MSASDVLADAFCDYLLDVEHRVAALESGAFISTDLERRVTALEKQAKGFMASINVADEALTGVERLIGALQCRVRKLEDK